ncbi:HesB/YadR/YfhF family protein [Virgibacillus kekensis]|uniref:HesB/YadR/YfhF family protein n=1 Tax=Virgibacillus kekensis TaxID=202261 RepID=A0ABV9DEN0_9BACI
MNYLKLTVTKSAAKWYKEELSLQNGDHVRFYVRYGFGGHIPGFSLGISVDTPTDIYASTEVDGVKFYVENKDAWYFDEGALKVKIDEDRQEPEFIYS